MMAVTRLVRGLFAPLVDTALLEWQLELSMLTSIRARSVHLAAQLETTRWISVTIVPWAIIVNSRDKQLRLHPSRQVGMETINPVKSNLTLSVAPLQLTVTRVLELLLAALMACGPRVRVQRLSVTVFLASVAHGADSRQCGIIKLAMASRSGRRPILTSHGKNSEMVLMTIATATVNVIKAISAWKEPHRRLQRMLLKDINVWISRCLI